MPYTINMNVLKKRTPVSSQNGFTLVELMVVIVILGILITVGLASYQGVINRSRQASVKTNMHSMHNVVELYAVDYSGIYPSSVENMLNDPEIGKQRVLTDLINPITGIAGLHHTYDNETIATKQPGMVTYDLSGDKLAYWLYGYDIYTQKLEERGRTYIVSSGDD